MQLSFLNYLIVKSSIYCCAQAKFTSMFKFPNLPAASRFGCVSPATLESEVNACLTQKYVGL